MTVDKVLCAKLAAFLLDLDSHGIYDVSGLVLDLNLKVGLLWDPQTRQLLTPNRERHATLPVATPEQVKKSIEERGLGGALKEAGAAWLVSGWDVAITFCKLAGLGDPSDYVMGRGKKFQLCVEALERAAV